MPHSNLDARGRQSLESVHDFPGIVEIARLAGQHCPRRAEKWGQVHFRALFG
jgi:hypothetical protein